MLPRRHILDVWEVTKAPGEYLPMAAATLAIDAIKYLKTEPPGRDHLVEALELNEFICYMYPSIRPHNRSLLFHVISDLLGLLLYGIPRKRRASIEYLEIIDYSNRNVSYPVMEVWRFLKCRVGTRKSTAEGIIEGFINKIRIEVDILQRYPFIEEILVASRSLLEQWLSSLSDFYRVPARDITRVYEEWSGRWIANGQQEHMVDEMVRRLASQAERDFGINIDKHAVKSSILSDRETNRHHNETFSTWYREGVDLLFRI